jgi:hypothetical protein
MGTADLESVLKNAAAEAADAAEHLSALLADGPMKNAFNNIPYPKQIPALVPRMRSGDCLKIICVNLPESAETIKAAMTITRAMQDVAARALAMDEPRLPTVEAASTALEKIIGYDSNTVHTVALVHTVYGEEAPFGSMWEPLKAVVLTLVQAQEFDGLERLIEAVRGVNDDNDLGCAISSVNRIVIQKMRGAAEHGEDARAEELGQLSYALSKLDNKVMGSELTVSREEYVAEVSKQFASTQRRSSASTNFG